MNLMRKCCTCVGLAMAGFTYQGHCRGGHGRRGSSCLAAWQPAQLHHCFDYTYSTEQFGQPSVGTVLFLRLPAHQAARPGSIQNNTAPGPVCGLGVGCGCLLDSRQYSTFLAFCCVQSYVGRHNFKQMMVNVHHYARSWRYNTVIKLPI